MSGDVRVRVADVLYALYEGCSGVVEFRAFGTTGLTDRLFAAVEDVDAIREFWTAHRTANLYWGVATRRDDRDGTLANCLYLPALFADCDFKLSSETDVRGRLEQFPLRPSVVVMSGGGLQAYWLLREPSDVAADSDDLRNLLRRLAAQLQADVVAGEPARVLRVPGTLNQKYAPARIVTIESFDPQRRYNLSEFDWLPCEPSRAAASAIDLAKTIGEFRNQTLYRLARALKGKRLPDAMIASTIDHVNRECCVPALDDSEVRQIVRNALTQPDRPMPTRQPIRMIEVA